MGSTINLGEEKSDITTALSQNRQTEPEAVPPDGQVYHTATQFEVYVVEYEQVYGEVVPGPPSGLYGDVQ